MLNCYLLSAGYFKVGSLDDEYYFLDCACIFFIVLKFMIEEKQEKF